MRTVQLKYSFENIISRIYGLFPFYDFSGDVPIVRKATYSADGCYGKVVPNLTVPEGLEIDGEPIIVKGETYTYRQIYDTYFEYKDLYPDNAFISFVRKGIGVKVVDLKGLGLDDSEKFPLAPERLNLSSVMTLKTELESLKESYERDGNGMYTDCTTCLSGKRFTDYGGYVFLGYLDTLLAEAEEIASEYLGYVSDKMLHTSFDVAILQSCSDLGMRSVYTNKWVPGERYYCGDIVTYEGVTYVCTLNRIRSVPCYDSQGDECEYVICDGVLYALNDEETDYVSVGVPCVVENLELYVNCASPLCEYIVCNGVYYHYDTSASRYFRISVCEYTTGRFDENTHSIVFDANHFTPISEFVSEYGTYGNEPTVEESEGWYTSRNSYGERYGIFVDSGFVPTEYIGEHLRVSGVFYAWNGNGYVVDDGNCNGYAINGSDESSLPMFRTDDVFISTANEHITPNFGKDFLSFYRVGKVANASVEYDGNGNISRYGQTTVHAGDIVADLYAYGDVLTDIICHPEERRIEFRYVIGAHLKAECVDVSVSELLQVLYFYDGRFIYDEGDTHGIKYVEFYEYEEGGDLDAMVNDGNFAYYVSNGNNAIVIRDEVADAYVSQGEDMTYGLSVPNVFVSEYFCTPGNGTEIGNIYKWNVQQSAYTAYSQNVSVYNYIGKPMEFYAVEEKVKSATTSYACVDYTMDYVENDYSETIENRLDVTYAPLFKFDYMNGIEYANVNNPGISVGRGNAASIERHVKLGETKTLEDVLLYSNGGFFNVVEG